MNGFTPIASVPIAATDETAELVRVSTAATSGGLSYAVAAVELGANLLWDTDDFIVWDDETYIGGEG
jgi:hypothetical protein